MTMPDSDSRLSQTKLADSLHKVLEFGERIFDMESAHLSAATYSLLPRRYENEETLEGESLAA